jgi:hypothetical protein
VVIGFVEIFYLTVLFPRVQQVLQFSDEFRLVKLGLFQKGSGHPEGNFEGGVRRDEFREHAGGRKIAFLGDLEEYGAVLLFPEKFAPIGMETKRLVELKIERDERHTLLTNKKRLSFAEYNGITVRKQHPTPERPLFDIPRPDEYDPSRAS